MVDEVSITLLQIENIKQSSSFSHIGQTFVMNFESHYGRNKLCGRYYDRRDDHS